MSDEETAYKAVELMIAELKLKPGAKLVAICPENWSPRQIAMFQAYANEHFKLKGLDFELICFPSGFELATISPIGGFTEENL